MTSKHHVVYSNTGSFISCHSTQKPHRGADLPTIHLGRGITWDHRPAQGEADCSCLPSFASAMSSREGAQAPSSKLWKCCPSRGASRKDNKDVTWNSGSLMALACSLLTEHFFFSFLFTKVSVCADNWDLWRGKGTSLYEWFVPERKTGTQRDTRREREERERMRTNEVLNKRPQGSWQEWTFQIVIQPSADSQVSY